MEGKGVFGVCRLKHSSSLENNSYRSNELLLIFMQSNTVS